MPEYVGLDAGLRSNPLLLHVNARALVGNVITPYVLATQIFNGYSRQEAAQDLDSFEQHVFLFAGTYTFRVVGFADDDCGRLDWFLDGTKIVSLQDWYVAHPGTVNTVANTASIVVAQSGWHRLRGTVNSKNGASSAFKINLSYYSFLPTA
jgi:hypothetical protein